MIPPAHLRPAALLPALLLLFCAGCPVYVTQEPEAEDESAAPAAALPAPPLPQPAAAAKPVPAAVPAASTGEKQFYRLEDLFAAARRNMLEIQTIESLQELAGEHVGNARLLQIPGLIDEWRTTVRNFDIDRDPRLKLLDDAIAYNDLLTLPPETDMVEHRRIRAGELLRYRVAALASRLVAARERLGIAPDDAEKRRAEELALELRILTGLPAEEIDELDSRALADPVAPPEKPELLYSAASERRSETAGFRLPARAVHTLRRLYRDDAAAEAMLAEALYRLPRRLAGHSMQEKEGFAMYTVHLANALGCAFEVDLDRRHLAAAWNRVHHAKLKLELHPGDREAALELVDATLSWRLAWYRLLTDLAIPLTGKLPAPSTPVTEPEQPGTLDLLCR